ncbi:MAG TPA: ROK family protein [Candidatus Limnocylindrales bacterium]|nr:ROK family protein [Candidatus Limnocylindrales bacterium]
MLQLGQRSESVRRANLSAIVRALHAAGPLSRSELVARTGLTRTAIRDLVGELVSAGLASEGSSEPLGTPGRPSRVVRLDACAAQVLALEIAVDSLAAARVGLGGDVLALQRIDRPADHVSVDAIVEDLTGLADRIGARGPRLVGVGVAVVGIVRRADGFVATAPNLRWRAAPLGERLAASLRVAAISVANEADLGALAEHRRGAAVGVDDVLFISGEVGVGGGIIVDGVPLRGVAGYGGEVGHLPINPAGRRCRCGAIGCWETEIGEEWLLLAGGYPSDGGREAVDALLGDAAAGSERARASLDELGRWLGIGLAGLVNVFNPAVIVLGGRFGRLHEYVRPIVEAELDRRALAAPRALVSIVPTRLGDDAPLIGAAELAFDPLLADPASWVSANGLHPAGAGA